MADVVGGGGPVAMATRVTVGVAGSRHRSRPAPSVHWSSCLRIPLNVSSLVLSFPYVARYTAHGLVAMLPLPCTQLKYIYNEEHFAHFKQNNPNDLVHITGEYSL